MPYFPLPWMLIISWKRIDNEKKDSVEKAIAEIVKAAPVVTASKEMPLDSDSFISIEKEIAAITVNNRIIGQGSYSALYPEGEILDIQVKKESYEAQNIKFTVTSNSPSEQIINLKKIEKNEENKETGEEKTTAEPETVSIQKSTPKEIPKMYEVHISIIPSDADFYINGKKVFGGQFTESFKEGETITITGKRNGFDNVTKKVTVNAYNLKNYQIKLEPKPIETVLSVSDSKITGNASWILPPEM